MNPWIGVLYFLIVLQIMFDAMVFNSIIHGEVAYRWALDEKAR